MKKTFNEFLATLESEDDRKDLQAAFDSKVAESIKKYVTNHPSGNDGVNSVIQELYSRLGNLEAVREQKNRDTELWRYAIERSYEKNIDFKIIADLLPVLQSEAAIDKKLDQLGALGDKLRANRINAEMALNSYRPGSGVERERNLDMSQLSQDEVVALELSNNLDNYLKSVEI